MLLNHYNNSPVQAITAIYPDYTWLLWKFHQTPKGFWPDINNQRLFFNWMGEKLNIKHMDGWRNVSLAEVYKLGKYK